MARARSVASGSENTEAPLGAPVARRARGPAAALAAGSPRGAGLRAGAAQRTSTRQMSNAASPRNRRLAEGASLAAVTARARLPSVSAAAAGLGHAPRAQPHAPSGAAAARRPRHARAFIRGACQLLLQRSLLAVAQLLRVLHQQHLRTGRRRVSGGAMRSSAPLRPAQALHAKDRACRRCASRAAAAGPRGAVKQPPAGYAGCCSGGAPRTRGARRVRTRSPFGKPGRAQKLGTRRMAPLSNAPAARARPGHSR